MFLSVVVFAAGYQCLCPLWFLEFVFVYLCDIFLFSNGSDL